MTTDDQDAEVGRLVRERRDLRAQQETLISTAQKLGALLSAIGKALTVRPVGQPYPAATLTINPDGSVRVSEEHYRQQILTGRFPTPTEIQELLSDAKRVQQRLSEIDAHLKGLGL